MFSVLVSKFPSFDGTEVASVLLFDGTEVSSVLVSKFTSFNGYAAIPREMADILCITCFL